ncbi:metal ABC transporter solute-binding protein, Zn/Mn family [Kocuria palustris]|uniref:metal ABC transporter solute-binding protein, Zn/Mn family n=1 Tax=Kocuria palustris TaxID=71999 RepID=UPI0011A41C58|nr:zinc ABC transporter substrate-binding protein [Kocuria palustris]
MRSAQDVARACLSAAAHDGRCVGPSRRRGPGRAPRRLTTAAAAGAGLLALAGCSAPAGGSGGDDEKLQVVTSTSVYAEIAREVAGPEVEVTPVIDSAAQDPHSYEATPQDRLTVEDADLVIVNGGGYDGFMDDLLAGSAVPVVDAVETSGLQDGEGAAGGHSHDSPEHAHAHEGHDDGAQHEGDDHGGHDHAGHGHGSHGHEGHDHGGFNEHVWYDLPSMEAVADAVGHELAEQDPEHSADYEDRAHELAGKLHDLHERAGRLELEGDFLATEPVAGYLLEEAGLEDATPEEFTAAIESGTDVPPQLYLEVSQLVSEDRIDLLAFNEHTASGQTEQLRSTAEEEGVDVASFTETVPEGQSYLQWMASNVETLEDLR